MIHPPEGILNPTPLSLTDPYGLRPLTALEKCLLSPYIPEVDLENADLRDGKVPWYLGYPSKYETPAYDLQGKIQRGLTNEDVKECEPCEQ